MSRYVGGIHAVREALRSERAPEKVLLRPDPSRRHHEILELARKRSVPVSTTDDRELSRLAEGEHQGVVALLSDHPTLTLDDLPLGEDEIVLALDGIEDPMNLGAMIRTAEAAGVHALVLPRRRAAPLTPAAVRASVGASSHLPLISVSSLADALLRLSRAGFTVVGLDAKASSLYEMSVRLRGPIVLVLGREGEGLHRLVRERCQELAAIPMFGNVGSLNVSVACGVALFELRRAWAVSRGDPSLRGKGGP